MNGALGTRFWGFVMGEAKDGEKAGVVVRPGAEAGDGIYRKGYADDVRAIEEAGVVADEHPGGTVGSAGLVGGTVDDSGCHVGRGCDLSYFGGEVEVLVGDVEGDDAGGCEVSAVELDCLGGEQVERDGVAGEGIDGEDIEVLCGFVRE
jgi:hypothetical protein